MTTQQPFMLGVFPPPLEDFIPERWETITGLASGTISTLAVTSVLLPGEPALQATAAAVAIASGWLFDRWNTREQRGGWLFDPPYQFIAPVATPTTNNANWELTDFFRTELKIDTIVTETRSHQFHIYKVATFNPKRIEANLEAVASKLGINPDEILYYPVFGSGVAAIITQIRDKAKWQAVPFKPDALTTRKLHSYIGESIRNEDVVLDRGIYPHMLVTGMTGAGKTEAFCADIASMRSTGLNVKIYIVDPKNTAQLQRQNADFYTIDINAGIAALERVFIIAQQRMKTYSAAGCDNYIEYVSKVNPDEELYCFYIDELAAFLRKNLTEELEKGEFPQHARAFNTLTTFLEQVRSSGVLLTGGVQTSKATNVPTDVRDHFGAKLIFATADANAGRTAGEGEAAALPMQGGFILKTGRQTVIGRGAYLKA